MRVLITGGAGFIGGALISKLLSETEYLIFNLDKLGFASDLSRIKFFDSNYQKRYSFLEVDLSNKDETLDAVRESNPDLIMHLAAESHVDRSIDGPETFVYSNVVGTFNLLEAAKDHWQKLSEIRKNNFRFHHISTDEVFGSLGKTGQFRETSPYDPRSPYSATKAASDHLVRSWYHTYGLPTILTNCSNNYGPWQFPEKLIPTVILNALFEKPIPLYGDGLNIRDWLFIDDHIDALILVAMKGEIGTSYCIGGNSEKTNQEVVHAICNSLEEICPTNIPYKNLISYVNDRPGHDRRYSVNTSRIHLELGWEPKCTFDMGIKKTINWYKDNLKWCNTVLTRSPTSG